MNHRIIIHHLSLFYSNTQEDIMEYSISNTNWSLGDEQQLKHFMELILQQIIILQVLSWFKTLKQLNNLLSEEKISY